MEKVPSLSLLANLKAMVQIASNFNCLEPLGTSRHNGAFRNPSRGCLPDYGHLVERYCVDATQAMPT